MSSSRDLVRSILRERLLVAYLLVTFVGGLALEVRPVWTQLVNQLVLLPLYIALIYAWTRNDTPLSASEIGRPARWREGIALVVPWLSIIALVAWALLTRQSTDATSALEAAPLASPKPSPTVTTTVTTVTTVTIDNAHLLWMRLGNVMASTLKQTLPALALCVIAQMSWRRLGFAPRYVGLAAVLIGIAFAIALILSLVSGVPLTTLPLFAYPAIIVPYFALQLFINALPEELGYRALTMQRWLALTRSPGVAITISTILFVSFHIPFLLLQNESLSLGTATMRLFFGGQQTGIVWAYLFYRTRSLWPGILWHGSNTVLGYVFV